MRFGVGRPERACLIGLRSRREVGVSPPGRRWVGESTPEMPALAAPRGCLLPTRGTRLKVKRRRLLCLRSQRQGGVSPSGTGHGRSALRSSPPIALRSPAPRKPRVYIHVHPLGGAKPCFAERHRRAHDEPCCCGPVHVPQSCRKETPHPDAADTVVAVDAFIGTLPILRRRFMHSSERCRDRGNALRVYRM